MVIRPLCKVLSVLTTRKLLSGPINGIRDTILRFYFNQHMLTLRSNIIIQKPFSDVLIDQMATLFSIFGPLPSSIFVKLDSKLCQIQNETSKDLANLVALQASTRFIYLFKNLLNFFPHNKIGHKSQQNPFSDSQNVF